MLFIVIIIVSGMVSFIAIVSVMFIVSGSCIGILMFIGIDILVV